MEAHDTIEPIKLKNYESDIKAASMVLMDGNIPTESMTFIMKLCTENGVPGLLN